MSQDRRSGEFLQPGEIARVIKMSMSQENGLDVPPAQADLFQGSPQSRDFADQPRIDQYHFLSRGIVKEVEGAVIAADGIDPKRVIQRHIV